MTDLRPVSCRAVSTYLRSVRTGVTDSEGEFSIVLATEEHDIVRLVPKADENRARRHNQLYTTVILTTLLYSY